MMRIPWKLGRFGLSLVLLLAGCGHAQQEGVRELTILHLNDMHARLLPDESGRGGWAHVATAIAEQRADSPGALLLNGGDLVQGSPVSSLYEGLPCFEIASLMGFDVMALGNHEFDYGWEKILEFDDAAGYPLLAANVADADGRLLVGTGHVMREVNGLRVAIIGALTEHLDQLTKEHQRGPWRVLPVAETISEYARRVREDADLVVVVGHLYGEEEDAILREATDVDVLISGHAHTGQSEPKLVDGRLGVKVRAYGVELGRLDLRVDPAARRVVWYDWNRIPVTATEYSPAPAVEERVEEWEAKVSEIVDVPIGTAHRRIGREEVREMVEEAMREAVGADLAYQNSSGIRDLLPQGELLGRHVWNVLPFGNAIVYGRFRGSQLPRAVRESRDIEPDREYILATNDFLADQWRSQGVAFTEQGPLVRDAMMDWVRARGDLR